MSYVPPHKVEIENEDLFELKAWLEEMRQERTSYAINYKMRYEEIRSLERRLAIFEKIMKQLP